VELEAWACRLQGERVVLEVEEELLHVGRLPRGTQMVPSQRLICRDGMLATNLAKFC
jgi:hypothetical protein